MQQDISIYHRWIPEWLKLPLLVLALFPHLMLMSLFHSNPTFSASFLDIEPVDVQFLLSLMYGSVVVALLLFARLFAYFRLRSYIILMCAVSTFILLLLAVVKDYNLVVGLRVLEGIFGLLEGACFLPLIIGQLKTRHARLIAYMMLYAIMLTGGTLTTSLLQTAIMDYGWQEMIYIVLGFHVLVLIICLLLFNGNRLVRKYPLYQIDYTSLIFLMIALHAGSFAILYGKKYYWFDSAYILISTFIALIFSGLFILRQRYAKRSLFHFEVFKYRQVVLGILLFFIFYIVRAGLNNVYGLMAGAWNWPWEYVLQMQYFNVAGTVIGVIASGLLLMKNMKSRIIFGLGFILLAIDCAWFTLIFYPAMNAETIGGPLFLQGFAQGWLFTPLVMYLTGGLPHYLSANGALMGTSARFWTTNIGFALMQNATSLLGKKHELLLQQGMDVISSAVPSVAVLRLLNKQALLLSNMEVFNALMWLSGLTAFLICCAGPLKLLLSVMRNKMNTR